MPDIITLWAGAASIGCGALTYFYLSCRISLDETTVDLRREEQVVGALENRISVLRADNNDLQKANIDLSREIGRIRAEQRASKPKRGPNGRFIPKAKA
jgi:hypothetical protein